MMARARFLNGSTLATRWSDQILLNHANQAQIQLSMDFDFPSATAYFQTIAPPTAGPVLAVVGTPGTQRITYALVAIASTGGGDSVPSPSTVIADAPNALNATNYVAATFPTVAGQSYRLLRQLPSDTFGSLLTTVVAMGVTTTINDQGQYAPQFYVPQRGNEWQLPEFVGTQRAYMRNASGSMQPLVPMDYDALLGILNESWDQSSGMILGAPPNSPQALVSQPTTYPVPSPIGGRVPLAVPFKGMPGRFQQPVYYIRGGSGGYIGCLPPPLGTDLLCLDFIPKPPILRQAQDLSLFPDAALDAIAYKMLEFMAFADRDSMFQTYHQLYDKEAVDLRITFCDTFMRDKPASQTPMTLRPQARSWPI